MKLIGVILSVLLGSYSFSVAQNSGTGVSIVPPKKEAKERPSTTGANTKNPGNPTNALDDNRVSKTTGKPALQPGTLK